MARGPPLAYLLVFFAIPALIMVLASFRTPRELGDLAPLADEAGTTWTSRCSVLHRVGVPGMFIKSAWYAALTTLACLLLAFPLAR